VVLLPAWLMEEPLILTYRILPAEAGSHIASSFRRKARHLPP
jgi:hypothetical protein